jgi:acetyl-CoA C-acetyltransferase
MPQPVIVAGARTPIGKLLGALSSLAAPELGGTAIRAAAELARRRFAAARAAP